MRRHMRDLVLESGDRVVIKTDTGEILGLKDNGEIEFRGMDDSGFEPVTAERTVTMEASVGPHSHLRGRPIKDLKLRRKYGVYLMAVHRHEQNISRDLPEVRLQFADTVLLEGPPEGLRRLMEDGGIVNLTEPADQAMRRSKAPIAIATIAAVMVLAALGVRGSSLEAHWFVTMPLGLFGVRGQLLHGIGVVGTIEADVEGSSLRDGQTVG